MKSVSVWAPNARRLELVVSDQRHELKRDDTGTFTSPQLKLEPGTDYAFSIDGGPPRPDPRSQWQPHGVHGPSRVLDPSFPWTDADFRAVPIGAAVIYELHVGTFAQDGTFDGVIERLPHLQTLGVTHIELMPVAEFPGGRGWGYDGVHLYAPESKYGGPLGLKRLVNACHARGIAVLLDVVYNHLGPDGNYLQEFGPYFADTVRTPWGSAVNFDGPQSGPVRRFFLDNALSWMEDFHLDGLRLDAVHAITDRSARHLLRQLADETADLSNRIAKPLVLIAESDLNDPRLVQRPEAGGYGLDAQWSDDFHHALHLLLTGEQNGVLRDFRGLPDVAHALERGFVYEGQHSAFRGRAHGMPLENISLRRLIVCLQNHDQVGNRARGERIGHLIAPKRARLGAALVLLGPFVPLLFQGEEWNASAPFQYFTDHEDPELARAVSEGRRREFSAFGWPPDAVPDPQDPKTFASSRLDFRELSQPDALAMFECYRTLIRLRRERPELASARVTTRFDERSGFLVVERPASRLALNFGSEPARVLLCADGGTPRATVLYAQEGAHLAGESIVLPPDSFAVVSFS